MSDIESPEFASLHPLRMRLVYLSTSSMFMTIVLLPLLYVFDPPLDFNDFFRLVQQVFPIFIGFLLSAVAYGLGTSRAGAIQVDRRRMINFILLSAFGLYWLGLISITILFLWSNSHHAPLNAGMSKDIYFTTITVLMSVITGVAGAISTKIFFDEYKPAVDSTANSGARQS